MAWKYHDHEAESKRDRSRITVFRRGEHKDVNIHDVQVGDIIGWGWGGKTARNRRKRGG